MGLDITTRTTWKELREAIEQNDYGESVQPYDLAAFAELEKEQGVDKLDCRIHTRTGSYGGLHMIREWYADLKGVPRTDREHRKNLIDYEHPTAMASHLIYHSDAEGYYLPDKFETPIMIDGLSVGSGIHLAAELREIDAAGKIPDGDRWRWLALFVPALVCVYARDIVKFS